MRGGIGYMACVDSLSVVLQCETVQDTVFNAVGVVFIAQLNEPYWDFIASIFALTNEHEEEWKVELDSRVWSTDGKIVLQGASCKAFFEAAVKRLPILRRCNGAFVMEDTLAIFMVFLVYMRGTFMIVQALDTLVLPATRDVCTLWRWQNHAEEGRQLVAAGYSFFIDHLTFIPLRNVTEVLHSHWLISQNNTDPCQPGGKYYRMQPSQYWHLARKHPVHVCLALFVIFIFLLGKSIASVIFLGCHQRSASSQKDSSQYDYVPASAEEADE